MNHTRGFARLLEGTLASYARLCRAKRKSKSELDRHETLIREAFHDIGTSLRQVTPDMGPTVYKIAHGIVLEGYDWAIQRHFNELRYPRAES